MMKIRVYSLLVMLFFLMISCRNGLQQEQRNTGNHELLTIVAQDFTLNTGYAAIIKGLQDISIIPRIEGYLQGIYVKEGDRVKAGQLLFRIDDAVWKAAVAEASANQQQMSAAMEKAQLEFEGKQKLHEKNVISDYELATAKSDLAVAKANLAAAQASLTSAQKNLSYTELRSPSDGVVGRIPYRKGDYVSPSIAYGLTRISDNGQMRVYFSMTEAKIMEYLSAYKSLTAAIEAMPELRLQFPNGQYYERTGRVESISGIIDEQTGAVSVCALFDNPEGVLLSGGTAKIVMPMVHASAIVIPQEATYSIQDKVYVMKVVDGRAVSTIIQVENQNNGKDYVVTDGLSAGDVIIAKGAGFVQEGTEIVEKREDGSQKSKERSHDDER